MSDFFQQSSSLFQDGIDSIDKSRLGMVLLILAIIVICVYTYKWYMKRRNREIKVLGPFELSTGEQHENPWSSLLTTEDSAKLQTVNNTTFSFFSYVQKQTESLNPLIAPEGEFEHLKYAIVLGHTLGIKFDPIHEKVIVDIYNVSVPGGSQEKQMVSKHSIVLNTIPVLKWNQITVSVEGRTVDIYVNGTLATSTLLENVPFTEFFGIWLNKSPDFTGQVCLFQMWPERRTATQILEDYKRNTDIRGKPLVPDFRLDVSGLFRSFCSMTGICGFQFEVSPLKYIDYEFA